MAQGSEISTRARMGVTLTLILVCLIGLSWNVYIVLESRSVWGVDFNQFYASSRLAGTGQLYDWPALQNIERENGLQVPTARLPVVAFGQKILGSLPFKMAALIWLVCSLGALVFFALLWPGVRFLSMAIALVCSVPATLGLIFGQDLAFWMAFFAAALALARTDKPWAAGLLFSFCICKYHLALGVPILLIAQNRWRTLTSGAVAGTTLIALSFLIEGARWPISYLETLSAPLLSPGIEQMPNLYGFSSWLPAAPVAELILAIAVAALCWLVCRRVNDIGIAGAAAAACGLLIGHHAYKSDCVLLIPLGVLIIHSQVAPAWVRIWAGITLTPLPLLILGSSRPYLGQAFIISFVTGALFILWKTSSTHEARQEAVPLLRCAKVAGSIADGRSL